ncbi:alpha-ketoglutarate-dependent dioxygenase alkB homolog 4 [Sphaerodactylus townsendi]|uniref:alpha-ketoglutarate-dependent dioxygenase alkB homolog 4 n=1 Tax=Sphaerodactylus townsendi TaxID=933632 RepID=UPI0020268FBD|nr:alpha-ketoglutarate-dependent dioxygenase alkB homolog 4 [Sphaerodactylus townsendi]
MAAVRGGGGGGRRVAGTSPAAAGASSAGPGACGCQGRRSCLLCEEAAPPPQKKENFVYCPLTGLAVGERPSGFAGWAFPFPGVFLLDDFISLEEESKIVELTDQNAWKPSQSGRRKQDYGPKVNFKKQKLKVTDFSGLPQFSQELVTRMRNHPSLAGFLPVEQCNLDYDPARGSAIDPHLDDCWLWGERLVSLNLLSSTVLSMSCDSEDGIQLFPAFPSTEEQMHGSASLSVSQNHHQPISFASAEGLRNTIQWEADCCSSTKVVPSKDITVGVHLPRRSLVVLYGPARYMWNHAIYRNHITSRRICITFRELSEEFSHGGEQEELGRKLLEIALTFQGTPV